MSHSSTRDISYRQSARLEVPRHWISWTIGLFVATFALGFIAKAVPGLRMAGLDAVVNSFYSHFANMIAKAADKLDKPTVVGAILIITFVILLPIAGWRRGLGACVSAGLGWLTTLPIKAIVNEPRPTGLDLPHHIKIHAATQSFPSGHVVFATALVTALILVSSRRLPRLLIGIIGGIFVLVVAWARIYVGVHYPTDVIGGILNGVAGVLLFASLWNIVFSRRTVADHDGSSSASTN